MPNINIDEILSLHREWVYTPRAGKRADFRHMELRGQSFAGACLEGACFANSDLRGAVFDGANVAGADFRNAKLNGASFRGAQLNNANLNDADTTGADFAGADTEGTKMSNSTGVRPQIYLLVPVTINSDGKPIDFSRGMDSL